MIAYHGTTYRRAQRICVEGFKPKKPSRRVWFAAGPGYARGRARTQARRAHDRPVVLTCNIDIGQLSKQLGAKRVMNKNGVIAIDGHVPITVLRSRPAAPDVPSSPGELAKWVNELLRFKPHKGVSRRHPGIDRLSRWVVNRLSSQPFGRIRPTELLGMARRWLPDFFEGFVVDPETLHASPKVETIEVEINVDAARPTARGSGQEDEALACLLDPKPKRRIRGLAILEKIEEPDLFEWCVMYLDDESTEVRIAALRMARRCEGGDPEVLAPLAESEDEQVRGAAIAAIAKHSGKDGPRWIAYGLKDHSRCVRGEVAPLLAELDPGKHRDVFELALYDPNPEIRRRAQALTAGKSWRRVSTWPQ